MKWRVFIFALLFVILCGVSWVFIARDIKFDVYVEVNGRRMYSHSEQFSHTVRVLLMLIVGFACTCIVYGITVIVRAAICRRNMQAKLRH